MQCYHCNIIISSDFPTDFQIVSLQVVFSCTFPCSKFEILTLCISWISRQGWSCDNMVTQSVQNETVFSKPLNDWSLSKVLFISLCGILFNEENNDWPLNQTHNAKLSSQLEWHSCEFSGRSRSFPASGTAWCGWSSFKASQIQGIHNNQTPLSRCKQREW